MLKEYDKNKEEIKRLNQAYRSFSIYETMVSSCLKCTENPESNNPKVARIKHGGIMLLPKWAVCDCKKFKFMKEQEASGLLSSWVMKAPLDKIHLVGTLLF